LIDLVDPAGYFFYPVLQGSHERRSGNLRIFLAGLNPGYLKLVVHACLLKKSTPAQINAGVHYKPVGFISGWQFLLASA
jgi:hypothetical protein